jgi:hypothetical protein
MRRRHLSVGILLAALLMGVWGQVLAAGPCPHMRQDHACCHAKVAHDHAAHGMTGDMQTTPAVESAQGATLDAADKPIEGCDHCMGRSSQSPPAATLREVDRTDHGTELAAPAVESKSSDLAYSFTAPVRSREHGPPKALAERHVLISVFRI